MSLCRHVDLHMPFDFSVEVRRHIGAVTEAFSRDGCGRVARPGGAGPPVPAGLAGDQEQDGGCGSQGKEEEGHEDGT